MEQFDDILRTFTNEINKVEKRFGKIRDEEKMLAVKKLMPESLLNYRFRGTTMSYSELFVALENIIIDKVATARSGKIDTSAAMEIGMTAKENGENANQEEDQAVYKGIGKGNWSFGKGHNWNEKGGKGGKTEGRTHGRKAVARKEAKGKKKVAREKPERVGRVARQDKNQLTTCKDCVCWKKVKMNSVKR